MEVNLPVLQRALEQIKSVHGIPWSEVTQKSKIHNIGRIARGEIVPTEESWEAIHLAFPEEIPEVQYLDKNGRILRVSPSALADFDLIPKYRARLSGGHGSFSDSDIIESNFAFKKDWIRRQSSNNLALFEVVGDSMAPFIVEGDVVLVDLNDNDPGYIIDGKTYAIREDSSVKVKRLIRQGDTLIIRSQDRENFPDYEADHDFKLIGRVIWVGHEIK